MASEEGGAGWLVVVVVVVVGGGSGACASGIGGAAVATTSTAEQEGALRRHLVCASRPHRSHRWPWPFTPRSSELQTPHDVGELYVWAVKVCDVQPQRRSAPSAQPPVGETTPRKTHGTKTLQQKSRRISVWELTMHVSAAPRAPEPLPH